MDWCIDTGRLGHTGCDASDLRRVLEDALQHHANTAPEGAAAAVMYLYRDVFRHDPASQAASTARLEAEEAKTRVLVKLPKIQEQMRGGIDAACALANAMGGRVTATVRGHHYPEHASGIFKRIAVLVDRAAPIEY